MYTTNQLAEATNLSHQTILNYVKEGTITAEVAPDGRHTFSEDLVFMLLTKKASMLLRNASLTIVFGATREELETFEECYSSDLRSRDVLRIDDIQNCLKRFKEVVQEDKKQQMLCMHSCIQATEKEFDKALEELKMKLVNRLLTKSNISDVGKLLPHREVLFEGSLEFMEEIDQSDRIHIKKCIDDFYLGRDRLVKKYCLTDLASIAEQFQNNPQELVDWEPTTGTVKGIFRKTQQKYFRLAVDKQIRKNLSNGYCSLIGVLAYESEAIYRLLKKAVSSEYSLIEVYGYERASSEQQDVIKFLQETKKVTICEQDLSTIIGRE